MAKFTGVYPQPTLRKGNGGTQVVYLQTWLRWAWKDLGCSVTVDGVFGSDTEWWVKFTQSQGGLTQDGVMGQHTVNFMKRVSK